MKKLITLLPLLAIFSLLSITIISCSNYQNTKDMPNLLTNVSKKQYENDNNTNKVANNNTNNSKGKINDNKKIEEKQNNTVINSSNTKNSEDFDAFKKPDVNEYNNKISNTKNDFLSSNKINEKESKNSFSNQASNKNDNKTVSNNKTNNIVKEKSWDEKLSEEDPQYLKLINFIEMISNSIEQFLIDNKYKLLVNYQQLSRLKFWDYFWNFFKTALLNVNATNKKLYNEIFDDAILQNGNLLSNECTYVLKSNNFISFTIGYDKTNLNFYFASIHPKYGRIDNKTIENVFRKKYEPIHCIIVLS